MIEVKPADWFNTRYVDFIPEHFTKFKLSRTIDMTTLLKWITENTNGRYSIGTQTKRHKQSFGSAFVAEEKSIGFEDPADATMFSLFYK